MNVINVRQANLVASVQYKDVDFDEIKAVMESADWEILSRLLSTYRCSLARGEGDTGVVATFDRVDGSGVAQQVLTWADGDFIVNWNPVLNNQFRLTFPQVLTSDTFNAQYVVIGSDNVQEG